MDRCSPIKRLQLCTYHGRGYRGLGRAAPVHSPSDGLGLFVGQPHDIYPGYTSLESATKSKPMQGTPYSILCLRFPVINLAIANY